MGGGKKPKAPAPSPYEAAAAQMAQKTFDQTDPLRQSILGQMGDFMGGGFDPMKSNMYAPLYAAARSGPEAQYNVARDNVLAGTPRGGGQVDALANVESARAAQVGEIPSMLSNQIMQDLLSKSYGVAFNAPQQSMAGMSSVAGTYGNRAAMSQASAANQMSSLYSGLGMMGGMALGGPGGAMAGKGAGQAAGKSEGGK